MKEKHKITKYQSGNTKTETYKDGDTSVTKHYYDAKDAYTKEIISLKDDITEIKHFTTKGVLAKLDHFVDGKRDGQEIKYMIAKANSSVKSSKMYADGKLHGECITYNQSDTIIKHEVFALGKLVLKYVHLDNDNIKNVEIIDKDSVENLPKIEYDKLQSYI